MSESELVVSDTLLRFLQAKRARPGQLIIVVAEDILRDLNGEDPPMKNLSFHGIKLTCDRSMSEGGVAVGWKQ